jgi:hypothetical protein
MDENLGEASSPSCSVFTVHPLGEIKDARPDSEPPAHISKTEFGVVEWEHIGVSRGDRITDETASRMGIQTDEEEKCQMMGVPEGFEALLAHFVVCRGIDKDHDKKHEMSRECAGLRIVDVKGAFLTNLCS